MEYKVSTFDDPEKYFGVINYKTKEISINTAKPKYRQRAAYIHELVHAYYGKCEEELHYRVVELAMCLAGLKAQLAVVAAKLKPNYKLVTKDDGIHIQDGGTLNLDNLGKEMIRLYCYYYKIPIMEGDINELYSFSQTHVPETYPKTVEVRSRDSV